MDTSTLEKIHAQITKNEQADLNVCLDFVRLPSISTTGEGIEQSCEYLCGLLRSINAELQIFRMKGHSPIVFGELKCPTPGKKTILFYGHYDVQPVEPLSAWQTPPFEPDIRDGRIWARGVADNKGQLLAHILAIKAYQETEADVPVNVKFLFEGEEEAGSEHLKAFVPAHKELLKADICYTADGGMHASGKPNMFFGVRGVAKMEVTLKTSTMDNHSGNKGNLIPNAAWELVKLMNQLVDKDGRCTVPGFYDALPEPTEYELAQIDKLEYDPVETARIFGVKEITLTKREFYTNLMYRPTFNINGMHSGHMGAGFKTIIPGSATARFDIRLVGSQDPEHIVELVADHIKRLRPDADVRLFKGGIPPSATSSELPVCKAVVEAVGRAYDCEPYVMPRIGGTLPEYLFTKIAGLPAVTMPYGNADENNHTPDENLKLECYFKGIHCSAEVLAALGDMH